GGQADEVGDGDRRLVVEQLAVQRALAGGDRRDQRALALDRAGVGRQVRDVRRPDLAGDQDLEPAVGALAVVGGVVGDRLVAAEAAGGEPARRDAVPGEIGLHGLGALLAELVVVLAGLVVVGGGVVGVARDPDGGRRV